MLTSRPILFGDKLSVHIDTKCFDVLLNGANAKAQNLLEFSSSEFKISEYFEFIRTPGETSFDILSNILPYELGIGRDGKKSVIWIKKSEDDLDTSCTHFGYTLTPETEYRLEALVWKSLNQNNPCSVFITDNKRILGERRQLEVDHVGQAFNIVTFDEGCEIIDLFLKNHKVYRITRIVSLAKGLWYQKSHESKIKRLYLGEPVQNAMVKRFTYLLMSLDKIGIQYYSGVDEDTLENTLYYQYLRQK